MMFSLLAASAFFIHSGDRVVFYGDSISEQQRYSTFVEAFVRCRYPGIKATFSSAGWAGDTAHGTMGWDEAGGTPEVRVNRDVTPRNPTVVTVLLGMNDAYYSPFHQDWLDVFSKEYSHVLDLLQAGAPQARLYLFGPTPWDDFTRAPSFPANIKGDGGYNAVLRHYSQAEHEIGDARKIPFVDLNVPVSDAMTRAAQKDPKLAQSLVPDWIHPDWSGGMIAASTIVQTWGAGPVVSDVAVDFGSHKVSRNMGSQVTLAEGLKWREKDASLPFPYDPTDKVMDLAATSCDLTVRLDMQPLQVAGLKPGSYDLCIDGEKVGHFSDVQFSQGINLSQYMTPMRKDAMKVLDLVKQKNNAQLTRWRQIERPFLGRLKSAPAALGGMQKVIDELESEIRTIAKPKWRVYELK